MIKYYVTGNVVEENLKAMDSVIVWEGNNPVPATILDNTGDELIVHTTNDSVIRVNEIICSLGITSDPIPFQGESFYSPEVIESDSYGLEGRF